MDLTTKVSNVYLTKACNIKPDADSSESKQVTLRVKFDDVTLGDVFAKAISQVVIQWQNGPGRKKFTSWVDKSVVNIEFKAPAQTQVDPEEAMVSRLTTMTPEAGEAYLKEMLAKAAAKATPAPTPVT